MTDVLVADSVAKAYGKRRILGNVYFRAAAGRVTGLFGRNGEGKSTLLKICAGVVAPDAGVVCLGDERFARPRLHQLARAGLFYLPAERSYLSPARTLREHLDALGEQLGRPDWRAAVEETDVAAHLDVPTVKLSGGERRLAELAVAFHRAPVCLLADEPLRGLSPIHAERVGALFRALAARGSAVVVTGHEVGFLFDVVDDVAWLTSGAARALGGPAEAAADWRFRREFLGTA